MKNTLTVTECAEMIGKSPQAVRIGLQRGAYKFGTAVQTKEPTKTRPRGAWDYHIPRQAVEHYMQYGNQSVLTREEIIKILGWERDSDDTDSPENKE